MSQLDFLGAKDTLAILRLDLADFAATAHENLVKKG